MSETYRATNNVPLPLTFVTSKQPLDAIFLTAGAISVNATVLQKYEGVGDHRVFIVDFTLDSILGNVFPREVSLGGRKLHCERELI